MPIGRQSAVVLSFRRLFGGEVDPVLRPVLASVGFGALGQFAFFAFFAVWALTERGAEATHVGLAYTCSGLAAVAGSLVGGRLSDRIGRQPVIVAASAVQAVTPAVLLVSSLPTLGAYGVLVVMGFVQPLRGTAQRALLADLIGEGGREEAYGAFRVVLNGGATLGPLVGALLVSWRWEPLFAGIVAASVVQTVTPAVLLVPGLPTLAAYGVLVVMGFVQPVRGTAQRACAGLARLNGRRGGPCTRERRCRPRP